jgi:hypothetical protein
MAINTDAIMGLIGPYAATNNANFSALKMQCPLINGYPGTRFTTRSGTRFQNYPEIRALGGAC